MLHEHRPEQSFFLCHICSILHSIKQKQNSGGTDMSDLAATSCCNNDCGCGVDTCGGNNSWLWIIILLFLCGGCGNNNGFLNSGDDCSCIFIILLLMCC